MLRFDYLSAIGTVLRFIHKCVIYNLSENNIADSGIMDEQNDKYSKGIRFLCTGITR